MGSKKLLTLLRRRGGVSIPTENLVLWWRLNDGSGTTADDWSANNNDGTLGAGAAAPAWGDTGLEFGGNDFVKCADFAGDDIAQPITVIVTITKGTGFDINTIFDTAAAEGGPFAYFLSPPFGPADILVMQCGGTYFTASADHDDGTTHHYACVFNGASSKCRIDGGNEANKTGTVGAGSAVGVTVGAKFAGDVGAVPAGTIVHDLRIYSGAMSDDDIDWHFNHVQSLRTSLF